MRKIKKPRKGCRWLDITDVYVCVCTCVCVQTNYRQIKKWNSQKMKWNIKNIFMIIIKHFQSSARSWYAVINIVLMIYTQSYGLNYSYLIIVICLHTVSWFQVFLSNTIIFQTDLFDP